MESLSVEEPLRGVHLGHILFPLNRLIIGIAPHNAPTFWPFAFSKFHHESQITQIPHRHQLFLAENDSHDFC